MDSSRNGGASGTRACTTMPTSSQSDTRRDDGGFRANQVQCWVACKAYPSSSAFVGLQPWP
eukprot:13052324-Alexandrium_andersonii.AAC.1